MLDHLGVAADDRDAGVACRRRYRAHFGLRISDGSPASSTKVRSRPAAGARDGEVVDGAVHRELADRAAREAQGRDHEAVGGERERRASHVDEGGVAQRLAASRS